MENIEQFAEMVYNYWKNRREELKFPLLRLLWKPNADEYNHMLAFRPREKDKRSLRRTNRIVEDQIIEQLYQQFDLAAKIVDRIQMREQLKLKMTAANLCSFYGECRSFAGLPDFLQELKMDDRAMDKERMKELHTDLENYKARKESIENMTVQESSINEVDQKQSIVNFLSTVVYEAEMLGLSYEKLFSNLAFGGQGKPRPVDKVSPPVVGDLVPVVEKMEEEPKNPESYIHFSLERFEDMLIRTFDEQESPVHHIRPCKDYLELKRRKVDLYYFGSDDEGEVKDLRKNIATSFKKYQQLQHTNRAISATSEN